MKITFVSHASILVETRGLRIISDPWWGQPCFGVQWWNYPLADTSNLHPQRIDYIYISHGHADHFHLPTLRAFPRTARVLIPAGSDMAATLRQAGFSVTEISATEQYDLGQGVKCRIVPTYNDDSLMVLDDGERTCLNLNDALHSAPRSVQEKFVSLLKSMYPTFDYLFCGYGTASHFPNCYRIPGKDYAGSARVRQEYFNRQWAWLVAAFGPRFAFPFAADVALLEEELIWANEVVHGGELPTSALKAAHPEYRGTALDIAPGFQIDGDTVSCARFREKFDSAELQRQLAHGIAKSRQYSVPRAEALASTLAMLQANVESCLPYLRSFSHDYLFAIKLRGTRAGYVVRKTAGIIDVHLQEDLSSIEKQAGLVMTTRLEYLRASLMTRYGSEILFVGSGVIFSVRSRADAEKNLQSELRVMVQRHDTPPPARPANNRLIRRLKGAVKSLLGRQEPLNLYDLVTWTRWT